MPIKLDLEPIDDYQPIKLDLEPIEVEPISYGVADPQDISLGTMQKFGVPELDLEPIGIEKRKPIFTALKHGYSQAGIRMVKGLAGLARVESEIGGKIRKVFWEDVVRTGRPRYI